MGEFGDGETFLCMYYHFVWATKQRMPALDERLAPRIYDYISSKCAELGVVVYALGGTPDHVHLACSLPATLSVAAFMNRIKGASSHFVNHLGGSHTHLAWQRGYGAMTFAAKQLPILRSYIATQAEHHENKSTKPLLERTCQVASASFLQT